MTELDKSTNNISKSLQDFTTNFYQNVASMENNIVCSALSAHVALSMVAYGADGKTGQEIRQALHLPKDDTEAYDGLKSIIDTLNKLSEVILRLANKIYPSNNIPVKDDFKDIIRKYFHSEIDTLDFSKAKESADIINQWCSDQTNAKIQKIILADDLCKEGGMILVNAVYFKGDWKHKFHEQVTELYTFHVNKTTMIDVPTMMNTAHYYYEFLEELNANCIALPYKNEDVFMVLVVPKEIDGLQLVEKNLEKFNIDYNKIKQSSRKIKLHLPKFKIETKIDLKFHLEKMGMLEMFTYDANFKGISKKPLKIDKVIQKAFIEVNEEGSEAAAVTSVQMSCCRSMPIPPMKVLVDRPFLYFIVYKDITLFSGRIINPLLE